MTTDFLRAGSEALPIRSAGGLTVRRYPVLPPRGLKPSLGLWRQLRRRIERFDLVHVHSLYLFHSAVGPALCRQRGVPYVVRPHGSLDPLIWQRRRGRKRIAEHLFEARNLARCAAVHFTHPREQREACLGGWPAAFVCPLGVDVEALRPSATGRELAEFRDRVGIEPDDRVALFLGRLTQRKGAHLAVAAAARLGTETRLKILLAGRDQEGLVASKRAAGTLPPAVRWCGQLDDGERRLALAAADVLIAPSSYDNFGLSVLEAMAAGLPPIVSSAVALADEVAQHQAGWVVELGDERAARTLAEAIVRALEAPSERQQRARRARDLAQRFDWQRIGELMEDHYHRIVAP